MIHFSKKNFFLFLLTSVAQKYFRIFWKLFSLEIGQKKLCWRRGWLFPEKFLPVIQLKTKSNGPFFFFLMWESTVLANIQRAETVNNERIVWFGTLIFPFSSLIWWETWGERKSSLKSIDSARLFRFEKRRFYWSCVVWCVWKTIRFANARDTYQRFLLKRRPFDWW